jgi:hypothetical protein
MVKPSLRTKSIGTKVAEEEYPKLERTAQAGGQDPGRMVPRSHVGQCECAGAEGPAVRWQ